MLVINYWQELTNGIMECTNETSLFSRLFMYLTILDSEWWLLNTLCVRYGDVLFREESRMDFSVSATRCAILK